MAGTLTVSDVPVAPAIVFHCENPTPRCCQRTDGVGKPEAAAVSVTFVPALAVVTDFGFFVTFGAYGFTLTVAAVVVAEPAVLVNTAR